MFDHFEKIFINNDSKESELGIRLRTLFPKERVEFVNERPFSKASGLLTADEFDRSKRNLYVTRYPGQFFKRCPGARPGLACCNYFVLNWGLQCDMNCSYCYLQSFINTPLLTIYSNLDEALHELKRFSSSLGDQPLRIGTGETVDSLSLDPLTLYSRQMIHFFKDYPNWSLEFKTKSSEVDQFLDMDHAGNVIVSWSINPQYIVDKEEHGTASLEARLQAAEKCLQRGFKIAFHIDPMIWHPEWKTNYGDLVQEITSRFSPFDLPYISLGALRFQPDQRHIMRERFGMKSLVTSAEMFIGQDGKYRYDRTVRSEMFTFVMDSFKKHSPDWKVFLCMETPETWLAAAGEKPQQSSSLQPLFDSKVVHKHRKALLSQ